MKKIFTIILIGILTILFLDAFGAIASRILDFDYSSLGLISFLIYGLVGFYIFKSANKLIWAFSGGCILGFFDATIGWWLSDVLNANITRMAVDSITIITIIVIMTLSAGITSLLIAFLTKLIFQAR